MHHSGLLLLTFEGPERVFFFFFFFFLGGGGTLYAKTETEKG